MLYSAANTTTGGTNTTYKIVLPFYAYASISLLVSTLFLFLSAESFIRHYFHPHTLAITHIMALGWGTMMILGASHQLVPVLIEKSLYSVPLGYASFILAAAGIPLLAYGFYVFDLGWPAKWGGGLVLLSIICFIINLAGSMEAAKKINIHAVYILTASMWLFLTASLGLSLVYNFSFTFLPEESLHYLPLHAHLGIIGWFLLLVMGVGSRLIPMFLISKYSNTRMLWTIYILVNGGLVLFLLSFLYFPARGITNLSVTVVLFGIILFGYYCVQAVKQRIRKQVDEQMKISILSVVLMALPLIFLVSVTGWLAVNNVNEKIALIYGFSVFFGWITAIIFGMTFKTLPFIVWNKVYHDKAGIRKTPNPKDLFSSRIFLLMVLVYLVGFILFITGVWFKDRTVLNTATSILVLSAILYNWNVIKVLIHKPTVS